MWAEVYFSSNYNQSITWMTPFLFHILHPCFLWWQGEQNVACGSWLWNDPGGDQENQYGSHDHIINALLQLHILITTYNTSDGRYCSYSHYSWPPCIEQVLNLSYFFSRTRDKDTTGMKSEMVRKNDKFSWLTLAFKFSFSSVLCSFCRWITHSEIILQQFRMLPKRRGTKIKAETLPLTYC